SPVFVIESTDRVAGHEYDDACSYVRPQTSNLRSTSDRMDRPCIQCRYPMMASKMCRRQVGVRILHDLRLEELGVAVPSLPLSLFCHYSNTARINLLILEESAAQRTRPIELNCCNILRQIISN